MCPMLHHQRPSTVPTGTIRSVGVRTRDGPERVDHAYRLLLDDALPTPSSGAQPGRHHDTEGMISCAPPSTPVFPPTDRNATRPSTASSPPCAAGSRPTATS